MNIITGMHRSASSLVSRLLSEAGADFGPTKTMYQADQWNPDGYFEQVEFHEINLPLVNGPWGNLSYFLLPSKKTILKRAKRRGEDIRRVSKKYQGMFVKEVRFSLTLPAWLEHGAKIDRILICLREPHQVAKSLKLRNHALMRHGLHMWYVHYRELLQSLNSIPNRIIFYEHLLDPNMAPAEVHGALQFMGIGINIAATRKLCSRVISLEKCDSSATGFTYPPKIQALWGSLKEKHARQAVET